MKLILCVDELGGVLFNRRRQSQDRLLRARILELTAGSELWMTAYSAKQFVEGGDFIVDEDCLAKAGENAYCFAEQGDVPLERCEELVLYRWGRQYPADTYFTADVEAEGLHLRSVTEFAGYSHETIREEIYTR